MEIPEPEDEPPSEADPEASEEQQAEVLEAHRIWQEKRQEELGLLKTRAAAATLLQRRIPKCLARMHTLKASRDPWPKWRPWLARMNSILAVLAVDAARSLIPADGAANSPPATSPPATSPPATSPPGSPGSTGRARTPRFNVRSRFPGYEEAVVKVLRYHARAMQLASWDGSVAQEVFGAAHLMWNSMQSLVNADEMLLQPLEPVEWKLEEMTFEVPVELPEGQVAASRPPTASKADPKAKPKSPPPKGAPAPEPVGETETITKKVWTAKPAPPNIPRYLQSATIALLHAIQEIKNGVPYFTAVVPATDTSPVMDSPAAQCTGNSTPTIAA